MLLSQGCQGEGSVEGEDAPPDTVVTFCSSGAMMPLLSHLLACTILPLCLGASHFSSLYKRHPLQEAFLCLSSTVTFHSFSFLDI